MKHKWEHRTNLHNLKLSFNTWYCPECKAQIGASGIFGSAEVETLDPIISESELKKVFQDCDLEKINKLINS